jgi:hypothetical protein
MESQCFDYISFIAKDVKSFLCLLTICTSYSLARLVIGLFVLLVFNFFKLFYSLGISPLSNV